MAIVDYTSLGSGSLPAMGVLEMEYRTDLSLVKAIALVLKAVSAGIRHDLGSGSQVDICILRKGSSDYRRCALPEESLPNHNINEQLNARKDDDNLIIGVNGFGNIPYTIRSKRVLSASLQTQREETLAVWKDEITKKNARSHHNVLNSWRGPKKSDAFLVQKTRSDARGCMLLRKTLT